MAIPLDAPLVHGIAMLHVTELEKGYHRTFPVAWRQEMEQRISQAIDQAIQSEVEAIERELPEDGR